jgi:hypothetical protein
VKDEQKQATITAVVNKAHDHMRNGSGRWAIRGSGQQQGVKQWAMGNKGQRTTARGKQWAMGNKGQRTTARGKTGAMMGKGATMVRVKRNGNGQRSMETGNG